jgi:hypothetical protein
LGKTFGDLTLPINSKPAKSDGQSSTSEKNKEIISDIVKHLSLLRLKLSLWIMLRLWLRKWGRWNMRNAE